MKTFNEFCMALKLRESKGAYNCVNTLGYLGAYQFGMARLCDFGLTMRKDPKSTSFKNDSFEFIPMLNKDIFLESPALQDFIFWVHVQEHKKRIEKRFNYLIDKTIDDFKVTLSGSIAVCHLLGFGGLIKLLNEKNNLCDAYGTCASEYMKLFGDYEIL